MASRGLGTLTLDLIAKIGGFEAGMDKAARHADKRMREIERRANAFGRALGTGIAVAGGIIVAGLTAATKAAIDQADAMRDLSIRTGVSTETLSAYGYAAKQTGTDVDALGRGLKILAKNAADALNPTSEQAKVLDALGINVTDATGKLKNLDQLVPEIANKFKQLEDGTTKAALAQALFGKSGLELTEFLNQGADGLDAFAQKAAELGIIIDSKTAAAADNFNDTLGDLKAAVGGLGLGIARELLPVLQETLAGLVELIKNGNLASDVASVFGAAINFAAGALSAYEKAVRTTSAAIEAYVKSVGGYAEFLRNIYSFGIADGSALGGLKKIGAAFKEGDAALDKIHNAKTGTFANVVGSATTVPASGGLDSRALALALSNPTASRGARSSKPGKSDAEREAEQLQQSYDRLVASLKEQIALTGQTSDVAKLRYDLENGELAKLNPQQKELLLTLAQTAEQRQADYDQLQKTIELEERQRENTANVLSDIQAQNDLLGKSAEYQDTYNKLKWAGVDANSEFGQSIIAANQALHKHAEIIIAQTDAMDGLRDASRGFLHDLRDGVGIWDSLKNAADNFAATLFDIIAQNLVKRALGEDGTSGGGGFGDIIGSLFGAFFGGGGGFGGAGSPLANGGPINPNLFHEVGENDRPEMLMRGGKQYLIPGNKGRVVPFAGGSGVAQTNNFYYAAPPDPRTQQQTAARVAFETRRASSRNS